jgi:hypothetical protein
MGGLILLRKYAKASRTKSRLQDDMQERLVYSALQARLREEWFALVETPDTWIDRGAIGEGESQSIRVENANTGLMAVAKPGPHKAAEEGHCRAAHEKLAFDLAYMAHLPVAPVVLWREAAPDTYKRGRSISAWAFEQSDKWDNANGRGIITPTLRDSAGPIVSAMRVFHTWISDTDRKSDHVQVNLDSPPQSLEMAFIDHANSLSFVWKSADHPTPPQPPYMPAPEHRDVMIETTDFIASIPDAEVSRIVARIDLPYLPEPQKAHILGNLLSRKGNLRTILGI